MKRADREAPWPDQGSQRSDEILTLKALSDLRKLAENIIYSIGLDREGLASRECGRWCFWRTDFDLWLRKPKEVAHRRSCGQ